MVVVMIGSGPERNESPQAPWKVVPGMSVDGLEQSQTDPDIDSENVKVLSEKAIEEWTGDRSLGQDEDL